MLVCAKIYFFQIIPLKSTRGHDKKQLLLFGAKKNSAVRAWLLDPIESYGHTVVMKKKMMKNLSTCLSLFNLKKKLFQN